MTLQSYRAALSTAVENAAAETAALAAEAARADCPVDTGNLRDSISARPDGTVAATAPYAAAVEFGTSRTPPRPFLAPQLDAHRAAFIEKIKGGLP